MSSNVGAAPKVVVTGASSGIGRAIVEALLARGQPVVAVARSLEPLAPHPQLSCHSLDLGELARLPAALADLTRRHPDAEALICCAGRGQFGSLEEFSYDQIKGLMDLNATSTFFLARAFLPLFKRRRGGDIVLMGSEAALWGGRRGAIYSASKAALRGFAQALREEAAKSGVRVCVINPGLVRTPFFDALAFAPAPGEEHALLATDVARAVLLALDQRVGGVIDEINLSPQKKVLQFKPPPS